MGVVGKLKTKLHEKGITTSDLPKAVAIHELLGILMLASTWTIAYHFPASSNPILRGPVANISQKTPLVLSNKFTSSLKALPWPPRVTEAYLESSCFRKLIRPVTLPGKLWLTYQAIQRLHGDDQTLQTGL